MELISVLVKESKCSFIKVLMGVPDYVTYKQHSHSSLCIIYLHRITQISNYPHKMRGQFLIPLWIFKKYCLRAMSIELTIHSFIIQKKKNRCITQNTFFTHSFATSSWHKNWVIEKKCLHHSGFLSFSFSLAQLIPWTSTYCSLLSACSACKQLELRLTSTHTNSSHPDCDCYSHTPVISLSLLYGKWLNQPARSWGLQRSRVEKFRRRHVCAYDLEMSFHVHVSTSLR